MSLKPHHLELLRYIAEQQVPVQSSSIDGRNLRPLRALGLVADLGEKVVATTEGRRCVDDSVGRSHQNALTEQQEDVLRYLLRQTGSVPADHLDGRVLRALATRGLVQEERGWVTPMSGAQACLTSHMDRQRTARRRRDPLASGRGETIRRPVDQLEAALPKDVEIIIGGVPAYGDDVVAALRRLAREMESRAASAA